MDVTDDEGLIGKQQLVDKIPKRFKELKFGVQSIQGMVDNAVLEVSDRMLYNVEKIRKPSPHGPLDPRLGTSAKGSVCETCGQGLELCNGHFGHVRLTLPAFHIGYLKLTINILQNICKDCSKVLLTDTERRTFLRQLRTPGIDNLKRTQICKRINEQCRKTKICHYCESINGQIRKSGAFKLVHDKYVAFNKSTSAKKIPPASLLAFNESFEEAKKNNADLDKYLKKAMDDMNPLRVLNLFKRISQSDCELLNMNPSEGRPEMFIWQYVPAPPICIRPSVQQDGASNEDDITTKLAEIIHVSSLLKAALQKGQPVATIMEQWDFLQTQVAMYVNSDVPGLIGAFEKRSSRGFCQRLKGKQGRFRGNLSGKRVDFSGRTVISPDPNLSIEQVAVPIKVAKNMTYPERAHTNNLGKLRRLIRNGTKVHPGANYIVKQGSGHKINLQFAKRENEAKYLKVGDVVERHLEDGDIVLFNRQPSLHKLSIMSHYAKIRPWRTFRLNECVCNPYNADFDGDEMNLHVPQTEEARTEAINLMGVKNNLSTPKNGEPIISATQDFITAAYLLSSKENFFDRKTFTNLCMYMVNANTHLDLPPPAICKPQALWTGKQVFSVLMRPNKESPVKVNLEAKCRDFKKPTWNKTVNGHFLAPDMDINDGWLVVRNSEVMCGRMDKTTIGSGKKECIFYIVLRDFGADEAVICMDRLSKISARYLTNMGFSIGISDVYPADSLVVKKEELINKGYAESNELIRQFKEGKLEKATGCDMEESLENKISGVLSDVRGKAGTICIDTLSKWNSPLIMAKSGSKGSNINVAQMVAVVGQQIIGGKRVADGFQDRTLPHFPKYARDAPAKGFVKNSFFSGLTPTEFLFHAISGREGLVDTAVKTAETGYMSRRLMKSLEDLSTQYDDTVRNSSGIVVQFQFGADSLDPVDMEGEAVPVNFERTWIHAESLTANHEDRCLLPFEVKRLCKELLDGPRSRYKRIDLFGHEFDYQNKDLDAEDQSQVRRGQLLVDQFESARAFLETITKFVDGMADRMAKLRSKAGLIEYNDDLEPQGQDAESKRDPYSSEWKQTAKAKGKAEQKVGVKNEKDRDRATRNRTARDEIATPPQKVTAREAAVERVAKISIPTMTKFVELALRKYATAKVEPGHAVGAVGAQSIGEPGTQMTLKTFHFAGVAGMSITQGVPRIKEIINASKLISTPVITCPLVCDDKLEAARVVKNRIEKIYVSDVIRFIEDMWSAQRSCISLSVDVDALNALNIGLTVADIADMIQRTRKLKLADVKCDETCIYIGVDSASGGNLGGRGPKAKAQLEDGASDLLLRVNYLKRILPTLMISGYPDATRAIIQTDEKNINKVLVEGYGLRACMTTPGVQGTKCRTNGVMECREVLGIEAARTTIANEIGSVMGEMGIDPRHMELLADVMTYKGEVLGITRFGLSKMRDSVLQLASFEKTPDHLFDAAAGMKTDLIEGVSESIIMGQTMSVGTGAFKVVRQLELRPEDTMRRATAFEDAWKWDRAERRKLAQKTKMGF